MGPAVSFDKSMSRWLSRGSTSLPNHVDTRELSTSTNSVFASSRFTRSTTFQGTYLYHRQRLLKILVHIKFRQFHSSREPSFYSPCPTQLVLQLAEHPACSLWERRSEVPPVIPLILRFLSLSISHPHCNNAGAFKLSVLRT